MIKLKSRGDIDFWNTEMCQIEDCYGAAEKIYASKELSIIDVCTEHYIRLMREDTNG